MLFKFEFGIIRQRLKKKFFLILLFLLVALFIRIYAASTVPLVDCDEKEMFNLVKKISFSYHNLFLPIGDLEVENPLLFVYMLKLWVIFFGEETVVMRMLPVVLGTFSIFFIYKLVEKNLGEKQGFLVLILLAFSQNHIGKTRLILTGAAYFFFIALTLLLFFKALRTERKKYVFLAGLTIGLGFLVYEGMLLLLPIFFIFLLWEKRYRFWLKRKDVYISLFIVLILISPYVIWASGNDFSKLQKEHVFEFGFSLRSFYLYFAEIFAWVSERLNQFYWDLSDGGDIYFRAPEGSLIFVSGISNEYPFVHWVLSVIIFISYFYCLKKHNRDNELIRFSLLMFGFVFIAVSIIAGRYSLLDDHEWVSVSLFPGVILVSHMLIKMGEKSRLMKSITAVLVIYLFVNSLKFINLPENQFAVPRNALYKYYLQRAEIYLQEGQWGKAIDRCQWVIKRCRDEKVLKEIRTMLATDEDSFN